MNEHTITTPAPRNVDTDRETMRAVVLRAEGAPDVLAVEDVTMPCVSAGEVRVRLTHAALNHLDLWIRKGMPSVAKPRVMGADGAGVIDQIGAGVEADRLGKRVLLDPSVTCGECRHCRAGATVYCDHFRVLGEHMAGTHAEYVVIPAANAHEIPQHLDAPHAAALPLAFATAWRMIMSRAQARPGERMLIWGASAGVGCAAIQIAAAYGMETVVTTRDANKLQALSDLGATYVINTSQEDVIDKVRAIWPDGVDIVFDHLGEVSWKPSMTLLGKGGRFVTCGATTGAHPPAQITRLFWKGLSVLGSTMASKEDVRQMLRFVEVHRIVPRVDTIFGMSEIVRAHEHVESASQIGKVVLDTSR